MSTLNYLSPEQYDAFWQDGFLVLKGLLAPSEIAATREIIRNMIPADLSIPENYHSNGGRIVPKPAPNRLNWFRAPLLPLTQNERLHAAVTDLFGTEQLHVVECSMMVKLRTHGDPGPTQSTHIDAHLPEQYDEEQLRYGVGMGGLWYLNDVPAHAGGTMVIKGGHQWVMDLYQKREDAKAYLSNFHDPDCPIDWPPLMEVTGQAGDYVLMHHLMPHCGSRNTLPPPRITQFTRFSLAQNRSAADSIVDDDQRTDAFMDQLTPLGRKLLNFVPW